MAKPSARGNLLLWELVVAFMMVTAAGILHAFHFFNNAWLQQQDSNFVYLRGLGDDCVKVNNGSNTMWCSEWGAEDNVFVKYNPKLLPKDINPPSTGLMLSRVMLILTALLYVVVIFLLFLACVKQDLLVKKLLCGSTLLLIFLDFFAAMPIIISSFSNIIANKGKCSLGKGFYYYLLSILLLMLGSAAHFQTWKDVYSFFKNDQSSNAAQKATVSQELNLLSEERQTSNLPS